jgi:hypothetical protein
MSLSLYTFANEPYVPGVVALINSARRHGFSGTIHIGSPEPLSISDHASQDLVFHVLGPSPFWPGNRKPELLLAQPSERFVFFDADMIVTQPHLFSKIESWIDAAPVFSVVALMVSNDYRRLTWARRLKHPTRLDRWPIPYFNSGFFAGIFDRDRPLFEQWHAAIREVLTPPGALWSDPDFIGSDQDVLNAILQNWEGQIIAIGPPDISSTAPYPFPFFSSLDSAVLHGIGLLKPWNMTTPPRRSPTAYELAWYKHAVAHSIPISNPVRLPRSVRRWLERRVISRVILAFHRLMKAVR